MLKQIYASLVLAYPRLTLLAVTLIVGLIATQALKIELDASAETLMLRDDPDLAFTREVNQRFYNPSFLIITYSPGSGLLDDSTLQNIRSMSEELEQIPHVDSVLSLLDVPLFQSPPLPLADLIVDIPTVNSPEVDIGLVREELLSSPIYSDNLVSSDFSTTAIVINLEPNPEYFELLYARNALRTNESNGALSTEEQLRLHQVSDNFNAVRREIRETNHQIIGEVREVMQQHADDADMFLGGVAMIADDMITYVRSDLAVYGSAVFLILVLILFAVFRQLRFIALPVIISTLSVIATTGLLGFFGWEITVVSSNFVALQLIVTMSLAIHLNVRYRELISKQTDRAHRDIILEACTSMFKPCLFVILTTVAGFSSLLASNILPIMNLGWMMSVGISISLIITFLVFPSAMVLLPEKSPYLGFERNFAVTKKLGDFAENHARTIFYATAVLVFFSVSGSFRLKVENSFIDYFKSDTEIYRGMEVIDTSLGGTTPLDVIVDFSASSAESAVTPEQTPTDNASPSLFDDFEAEIAEEIDDPQYWFTAEKMASIEAVHDYLDGLEQIGKVLSFGTVLKTGRIINAGEDLDNLELALLYNELPDEYESLLLEPFIDIENEQARFSARIIDSQDDLRRNELIGQISRELHVSVGMPAESVRLAGMMVLYNNMLQSLFESQIQTLGLVVIILAAMFLLVFRSLKIAFIAMIANVVAVGVVFGFMGWAGIPLDIMTITIAAISLGIAVDDTIHYLHRFEIEVGKDGDYDAAMHRSHNSIGYAMYYTTMVIIVGFSVLILSNFTPTIYFGLLTVVAMLMALIADLLLLPRLILWTRPFKGY